jgi:hypothetical protein
MRWNFWKGEPMITTLYDEWRAALAMLAALAHDLTAEGDQLFAKWLARCQAIKRAILESEEHNGNP